MQKLQKNQRTRTNALNSRRGKSFSTSVFSQQHFCFAWAMVWATAHLSHVASGVSQGNWEMVSLTSGCWHICGPHLASISHFTSWNHYTSNGTSTRINPTLKVPAKPGIARADCNSQGVSTLLCDKIDSSSLFLFFFLLFFFFLCANVGRKRACNLIPSSVCVGRALVAYVHREWT